MDDAAEKKQGLPSADALQSAMMRARESVRILIPKSGCEVASRLLALDLLRDGHAAAVVTGFFVRDGKRVPHTWVEVDGRILDPTQEQFSVPPEAEADEDRYVGRATRLTERGEIEASLTEGLAMQTWNEERRQLVAEVARRHRLSIDTRALLRARRRLMERIAIGTSSGNLSVTPISELAPPDSES